MLALSVWTGAGCTGDAGSGGEAVERRPNVILISIDGLRYDRTSLAGNPNDPTPSLVAFAQNAIQFPLAFSQSNESLLSHAALLTGRYASEISRPNYETFIVDDGELVLPEILRRYGYRTGAFVGGGHVKGVFGFAQGFDLFWETEAPFGSLREATLAAMNWIDEIPIGQPFFAFVHGYDCHRPYLHQGIFHHPFGQTYRGVADTIAHDRNATERIYGGTYYPGLDFPRIWHAVGEKMLDPRIYQTDPQAFESLARGAPQKLSDEDLGHIFDHYDSGAFAADTYVGFFLEWLEYSGALNNSIVVITSDHGEDLQTHGFTNHRAVLFDSTTRVPLLLGGGALPRDWRGTINRELVSAIDVLPTICEAVDVRGPASQRGRSLWRDPSAASAEPPTVFQEGVLGQVSARTTEHRLVFAGPSLMESDYLLQLVREPSACERISLFHSAEDPHEQRDIANIEPELTEEIRRQLVEWRLGLELSADPGAEPPAEVREALRERGYW